MVTNKITLPIYNQDGTPFNDLVLKKPVVESVVMSLGDKITGELYYNGTGLHFAMNEYVLYNGVKYSLISPPTIVREGMVSDNSTLKGATKYSLVFYHPMYMLGNFDFTDIAVTLDEKRYLSQNKTFAWVGNLYEFIAKLNANLSQTEWIVSANIPSSDETQKQKAEKISDVLSFDKVFVSDALKTAYETWEIPFVITSINEGDEYYSQGKRFLIEFGLPTQEIYGNDGVTPFVFEFGQGVGLKNKSRTPKNNKIVTRLCGSGSERNIPFGYPQILWTGNQDWDYTINNDPNAPHSYPIYKGIVGGQYVKLIKHPFTRKTLMPSIYSETVNKKVNPYATGYNPDTEIIDYYDADSSYPNPINTLAPSVEIHQFEDVYPRLGDAQIVGAYPYDDNGSYYTYSNWYTYINGRVDALQNLGKSGYELDLIVILRDVTCFWNPDSINEGSVIPSWSGSWDTGSCTATITIEAGENWVYATIVSPWYNSTYKILQPNGTAVAEWDDTMDDNGEYIQSYFKIRLPQLSFDLYASASITEEMQINMRSGACLGCTFNIQVDWEDYKKNFYDDEGNFAPDGEQRDLVKYPKSNLGQIEVIVQKDINTFGTLMPNIYQKPVYGDKFVILGISLPLTYISSAEQELDDAMLEYMLENNVHYYEYPLKFDEFFLATHENILAQIKNNNIVRFEYNGTTMALYIKAITITHGEGVLPRYDITLTDDVEIVLNQVGQVTDDVSRMRVQVSELQKYYSENIIQAINEKLSKVVDDVVQGHITFQQGLDILGDVLFRDTLRSPDFESGLYDGKGWRIDNLGNAEFQSMRVRSYLEIVELLVNRMQAQEGDTAYTDNDQIEKVEEIEYNNITYYRLSLKEKWAGYVTSQQVGNILRGVINTLAAREAGISEEVTTNAYYTSWMRVVNVPSGSGITLSKNQILTLLYGNESVPSGKNFAPCELMTIARWGSELDPNEQGISASEKSRRKHLQSSFYISTTDGRITKLIGVSSPILSSANYGTTLGELPDFVKSMSGISSRLIDGRDYLYAQGIVVGDFIKITSDGSPIIEYVDKGDWQNNTTYLVNEYNADTMQYETHDVWHNGSYWRCKIHQPHNGVYNEPSDGSIYWEKLLRSGTDGVPAITGYCDYLFGKDAQGNNKPAASAAIEGAIDLMYYTGNPKQNDCIDIVEGSASEGWLWGAWSVEPSTAYIWKGNGHVYRATNNGWEDEGQFNGRDGATQQQIFYRNSNNQTPSTPATSQSEGAPTGWTLTPQGVSDVYKYEWVSIRTKTNGVWGAYSQPAVFAYHAEDGTSIRIRGGAIEFVQGTWPDVLEPYEGDLTTTNIGDIILFDEAEDRTDSARIIKRVQPYIEDDKEWNFTTEVVPVGEGYLIVSKDGQASDEGHLYVAKDWSDESDYFYWQDCGRIKGEKGDDGISYGFVFTEAFAKADIDKEITGNIKGYAYKYVGGVRTPLVQTAIRFGYILNDSDTYADTTTDANGFFDTQGWFNGDNIDDYAKGSPSIFAAIEIDRVIVHVEYITISLQGDTGGRGKIGRFFYFGGVWEDTASSASFVLNDSQAPYFEHTVSGQKQYHVYNPSTNPTGGTITKATMALTNWNSKPWEIMTNDFKYLITEAIFAKLANFGGAIINGDWMISQYGIKLGSTPTGVPNYTFFDPFLPKGSSQLISGRMIASTEDITFNIEVIGERTYSFDITSNLSEASGSTKNLSISIDNLSESWTVFADVTTIGFTPATSGTYTMRITNNAQSAVTVGVLMYYEDAFTPNYALDLRTGKSYLQNADISGNVSASTIIAENDQMTTSIQAGVLTIRSKTSPSYGTFAVNDDGEIMLQMYDKDGVLRVNLGGSPTVVISGKWVETEMKEFDVQHPIEISDADCVAYAKDCTKYYQLQLGKQIQNGTIIGYYMPDGSPVTSSQAELIDSRTYESKNTNNPISGYYTVRNDGIFFQKQIDKDALVIPVCIIQEYNNGLLVQTHEHYMS